ncbi:MAG: hypothetical protein PHF31_14625 [Methylobacter sp.]|nr:hypothetical protein [Methylobacter sp.]
MSDMREINSEIVEVQGKLQSMPSYQGLIKVNRFLMTLVFFLMIVVLIVGFLSVPAYNLMSKNITPTEAYASEMNPVLSVEVNSLKRQLVGLISGSIENKLATLEESIRLGTVTNSLGTIEELKNDVKVLRSYSDTPKKENAVVSNEQLRQEMSQLKNLIYVSLASCGLMLAAVAGIWIKKRNRLSYKNDTIRYLKRN